MDNQQEILEMLVRDRQQALLSYAYVVCGDVNLAQDLVQDALVKTFSRARPGLSPHKAEGYVRRAITSTYIDGYRREQRWRKVRHLFRPNIATNSLSAFVEVGVDVESALQALTPRQRACIILRYFDDLSVNEIGNQLGISAGTVKRYLSDAIKSLQLRLGNLEDASLVTTSIPLVSRASEAGLGNIYD